MTGAPQLLQLRIVLARLISLARTRQLHDQALGRTIAELEDALIELRRIQEGRNIR